MSTIKPTLKVLQLAAYGSNIGDNANISGIRASLSDSFSDYVLDFTDWDIVDFSWGLDDFSDESIQRINSFDLFLIGGGGFLEIIPGANTWTGTRINIPKEIFARITTPIVFYAVGIDTVRADLVGRPIDVETEKFCNFIDFANTRSNMLLSARHDGSFDVIRRLAGAKRLESFSLVPDGGFKATYRDFYHPEINPDKINIAINFGGDLVDARYQVDYPENPLANNPLNLRRPKDYESPNHSSHKGYNKFLISFANVVRQLSYDLKDVNFIFVPHIYRDLESAYHLLAETGFPYCRREMTLAPYIHGFSGKDYIVDLYAKCQLTIGMRFHANVCPIGLQTPSIGLGTFPMINNLYSALDIKSQFIQAAAGQDFEESLLKLVKQSLTNTDAIRTLYGQRKKSLHQLTEDFHDKIKKLVLKK